MISSFYFPVCIFSQLIIDGFIVLKGFQSHRTTRSPCAGVLWAPSERKAVLLLKVYSKISFWLNKGSPSAGRIMTMSEQEQIEDDRTRHLPDIKTTNTKRTILLSPMDRFDKLLSFTLNVILLRVQNQDFIDNEKYELDLFFSLS